MASTTSAWQIDSLRQVVNDKPKNAKAMAKLSCALIDQAKAAPIEEESEAIRQEALRWAEKAVKVKPSKPFGYLALSVSSPSHSERMGALRKAVDINYRTNDGGEKETDGITTGMIQALVRLLIEPREEETQTLRAMASTSGKSVGSASTKHPMRRDLDKSETDIYERIRKASDLTAQRISQRRSCAEDRRCEAETHKQATMEALSFARTQYRLGVLFRKMNPDGIHISKSQFHFQNVVKATHDINDDDPLSKKATFWLATLGTESRQNESVDSISAVEINRCPEEYIVSLYSSFAAKFDELLVDKLGYRTPILLRQLVDSVVVDFHTGGIWAKRGADLGCGTGLSGIAFRDCVAELTGVDLSPEMVDKARDRGCYDSLVVGDVESILRSETASAEESPHFDIIFACDVFVYIGDLRSVFAAVRRSLSSDCGIFAFSTELLEEHISGKHGYVLHPCARFAHKKTYICGLAEEFGFQCNAIEIKTIRKNQGKDVKGILFVVSVQQEMHKNSAS